MMVGAVDVAIAEQTATIIFLDDHVVFRIADCRSALKVRKLSFLKPETIGKLLSSKKIVLMVQFGNRNPVELFPHPGWIVRWISPAIREMLRAAKG